VGLANASYASPSLTVYHNAVVLCLFFPFLFLFLFQLFLRLVLVLPPLGGKDPSRGLCHQPSPLWPHIKGKGLCPMITTMGG
jgi:hypothetical protein